MQPLTTTAVYDAKRKILIPQKFPPYRQFTVRVVFTPQADAAQEFSDDITQALKEVEKGNVTGPFQTIPELKKSLEA